jgi:single-strand DNA-binding protein
MNNAVLLATLEYSPELRHTIDNKEVSETIVSFEEKETTYTLRAIAWGKTATSFHQELRQGDVVIFEGSLQINTVDRPEGFKEKRVELVVQKFKKINSGSSSPMAAPAPAPVVATNQDTSEPDPEDIPF